MRKSVICMVLLLTACDPGQVALLAPDKSPSEAPTLTIRAVIDTPYADVASALEWTAGIPAAQVRVHKMEEPYETSYWHVATADSNGLATFADLLSGLYEVEVTRWLSGPEMVQADSALHLLAGGRRLYVSPGAEQAVTTAPDHRGSLVFGELGLAWPLPWDIPVEVATDTRYFDIYNNSDTTIYLDGKYWGLGWDKNRDYSAWPCAQTGIVRNDSGGVWTKMVFRFPGAGTDYPLQPGEAALVARAAIDHREVHPDLFDLRAARFEWGGGSASDNPAVPNLLDVGLESMHYSFPNMQPEFLSEPVDLDALPRYVDPHTGDPWVRIPADKVLDTFTEVIDWTTHNYDATPACREDMHRFFERLAGPAGAISDFYEGLSYQRRVLYALPDGRKVLQDTETSMVDFVKAVRSPGWIPDSLP